MGAYSGQPGGNPAGWWMPSHTTESNRLLTLDGYTDGGKNASGGAAAWGATQLTYGKYEVRFRADAGDGYGYTFLLWPATGTWPSAGEIDFGEDGGGNRQSTTATLHYGANNSQIARTVSADFTQWHTLGVEWTPGKLVYTLDGQPWGTVTGSSVPSGPMFLAVQEAALACSQWTTCVDSSTPAHTRIQIDWVVAYAQAPATTSAAVPASPVSGGGGLAPSAVLLAPLGLAAVTTSRGRRPRPSRRRRRS